MRPLVSEGLDRVPANMRPSVSEASDKSSASLELKSSKRRTAPLQRQQNASRMLVASSHKSSVAPRLRSHKADADGGRGAVVDGGRPAPGGTSNASNRSSSATGGSTVPASSTSPAGHTAPSRASGGSPVIAEARFIPGDQHEADFVNVTLHQCEAEAAAAAAQAEQDALDQDRERRVGPWAPEARRPPPSVVRDRNQSGPATSAPQPRPVVPWTNASRVQAEVARRGGPGEYGQH